MTGTASALILERVTRHYEGNAVPSVVDVSLTVGRGELLALVGASGSGKTTILRLAAGYEPLDAGRVLLAGADGTTRDIGGEPPQRRGFGMVFQHYALFPHLSVQENVAFGLEARGVRRTGRLERARAALRDVGLADKASRPVQALSGGEQQRVAIARALVIEPPILLLDEPLSNLDPALRETTRDELRTMLRRSGVTALLVTHDQEDAFAVADRVAMLAAGRLLQVGTPEALYDEPASREVAEFVGRATLLPARRTGDRVELTLAGVRASAPARGAHRDGALQAVLRPESFALTAADADGCWRGEVTGARFAGVHSVYRVRVASDDVVEVLGEPGACRPGDRVGVRLSGRPLATVAR